MFTFFKKPVISPERQRREMQKYKLGSTTSTFPRELAADPLPLPEVIESDGESGWSLWDESLSAEAVRR